MQAYTQTVARHETPWGVTLYEYGDGKKYHEPQPAVVNRAPGRRKPRTPGEVVWDRETQRVNGVALIDCWTGRGAITTTKNHWELLRVVVGRRHKLVCEAVCRGPHCNNTERGFDASDWTGSRSSRESHWCSTCRNENGGPRNKPNHTPMILAVPVIEERGWGVGTVLMADRWKAPLRIFAVLGNTVRLTDGKTYVWTKRLPVDVREYE